MLLKTTHVFAHHTGLDLPCDVYEAPNYPTSTPVFLFFHAGGLVAGSRENIPPWLVQVCLERQWPLISAGYRLLPQTGPKGLLEDALAAYRFAREWKAPGRKVIAGGCSGGKMLSFIIRHVT
jgi:acetyl esterase/lipase